MKKKQRKRKEKEARRENTASLNDSPVTERVEEKELQTETPGQRAQKSQPKGSLTMKAKELLRGAHLTDWIIMIFTGILAGLAIVQGILLDGQLDTMRKDQRAWVSLAAGDPQITQDPTSGNVTISWSLTLTNTGKTLARHSSAEIVVDTVRNGEAPQFTYDSGITWETDAVVFPNNPVSILGKMLHKTKIKDHPEETILTRTEYQDLLDGTQYLVVYARSSYFDIFRKEHWQHFCGFKSLSPKPITVVGARDCTNYNDVDDH